MIGVLTCPSPKGEGMGLNPFLWDGEIESPRKFWFDEQRLLPRRRRVPEPFGRLRINSASGRRERGLNEERLYFPRDRFQICNSHPKL